MSKSPKALLPSSLSLASFSRALPAANAAQRQSASIASTSAKRTATANGHAVEASAASEAVGRPPQSRPASPLSTQPARRSTHAARVAAHRAAYASSSSTASSSRSSAGPLLRRARSVAASPSSGHYYPSFTDASSSACASSSSGAGPSRYFHSAHCTRHQQAISPASGSSGGGIVPPPGSEHHASSSGALEGGAGGGASGADGPFQAKHHSSLPLASHDGPTLLSGSVAPGSGSGSSPPTALDAAPSSTTPASTSQTQQHHSSSTSSNAIPATLFSHAPPASLPSHALPAFFGSALNIARRSNLVFRNGAYGIPKADHHRARVSAKGKEKAISLAEASDAEHYLSVGVGEDAYFLRPDSLGVADGVGGWSGHAGANSARWARKFMHHCSAELARYENVDDDMFLHYYEVDPVDVMQRAYEKTLSECKEEGTIGSSTALLAILRNDELRLANLGDCSCCVIRGDEYIFRTEEQQHRFNYPFQAGTNAKDTPAKDAQKFAIKVRKDDIVILSSDGLVDNVFSDDMLDEVLRFVGSATPPPPNLPTSTPTTTNGNGVGPPRFSLRRFSPQAVSEALCHRAKSVYEDQRAVASPFQQRAMEEGIHYAGGKIDDISCLVGVVGELEASPNRRDVT
ncbi:hypothetical protein B0A53_03980 [Rhodotorula sp. CCFEE 5036]|nr:hypothetical protein B0A53_03980 [Rhodotorula sp. CCFEE 5036]